VEREGGSDGRGGEKVGNKRKNKKVGGGEKEGGRWRRGVVGVGRG